MSEPFFAPSHKAASTLDFSTLPNFGKHEFPYGVLDNTDSSVILLLQFIRSHLPANQGIYPSPLPDAWYRLSEKSSPSMHYAGNNQLSKAGDFFLSSNICPFTFMMLILHLGITGVGLYLDTQYNGKWMVMVHIDLRPESRKTFWIRTRTKNQNPFLSKDERGEELYIYPTSSPLNFERAANAITQFIAAQ